MMEFLPPKSKRPWVYGLKPFCAWAAENPGTAPTTAKTTNPGDFPGTQPFHHPKSRRLATQNETKTEQTLPFGRAIPYSGQP